MTAEDLRNVARALGSATGIDAYAHFLVGQHVGQRLLDLYPNTGLAIGDFVKLAQGIEPAECGGPPIVP